MFIHAVNGAAFTLDGNYEIVLSSKLDSNATISNGSVALANNESIILRKN